MEKFDDIFATWQSEMGAVLPDAPAMLRAVSQHQKRHTRRMILILTLILITFILFVLVIIFGDHKLWTTGAGESLFILCFTLIFWIKYRTYVRKKNIELLTNEQYLQELKTQKIKDFSAIPYKHLFVFFLWLSSMSLYMYEWVSESTVSLVTGYGCLAGFGLFMWFVYRPYMKKIYWKKNQRFIDQIDTLKNQIK